jgi:O-antigen/teichoic acid export membrane protein
MTGRSEGPARTSAALALGSVVSGLLAYVLFAMITRGLGAVAAAPVSVLWTHWAFAGAGFTFPLQHWITRNLVAGREDVVRRAAGRVSGVVLAASLVLGLLAWLARDPLFHRSDAWFPVMITLVTLGSAVVGVVRGGLGGRGRLEAVAWSLVAENGLRCVLVGVLLLMGVEDPVAHGLCLVAGSLIVVLWPAALRFADVGGSSSGAAGPLAFLTGAASGQLVSQAVLTGAPVVLALLGGAPHEVTAMFAALALFRAPYMVALGSVPQLTVRVTRRSVLGEHEVVRSLVGRLAAAGIAAAVLAGLGAAWLGPPLLRLVFGTTVDVDGGHAALLAAGSTVAVANLVLMVVSLAQDRPVAVARSWAAAVVAGAVALLVLHGAGAVDATVAAFLTAEVAALAALALVAGRAPAPLSDPRA